MALAIALEVTPNRLLLVSPVSDAADPLEPGGILWLVPKVVAPAKDIWMWACGEKLIRVLGRGSYSADEAWRWITENRPHRPPVRLEPKEWQEIDPFLKRFEKLSREVTDAGYDVRALFEPVVFEAPEDAEGES